jgi:hypothetical protein
MLTVLCGFDSWEVVTFSIRRMQPSEYDEDVSEEVWLNRQKWYVQVLTKMYSLTENKAKHFISTMSPSTKGKFSSSFEMSDNAHIYQNSDTTFNDNYQGFNLSRLIGSISGWCYDPRRMHSGFAISQLTWDYIWKNVLDELGWHVIRCEEDDGEMYEDHFPDIGQPSLLTYEGPTNNPVPIHLCSSVRTPGEVAHPPTLVFMKACVGDLIMNWPKSKHCIIFWGYPQRAVFNRIPYCCLGAMYNSRSKNWKDLFFNVSCNSFGRLLELNEVAPDLISGCPKLADADYIMSSRVAYEFNPLPLGGEESNRHLVVLQTEKGWERIRSVYDFGSGIDEYSLW